MFGYLNTQMFKAVPGGYIFQLPPPTRFHHTQAYVVNDAQKYDIQAISRRGRTFWLRTVTLTALALAFGSGFLIRTYEAPFWLALFLGCCVWLIAQVLGTVLAHHVRLRQLEPVLAGLPRSDERLFPEFDRKQLLFGAPSPRYIAIWCALFGFLLGERFDQQLPFMDVTSTVLLAALAINLFWAFRGAPAAALGTKGQ
jgi:hypothetical protein